MRKNKLPKSLPSSLRANAKQSDQNVDEIAAGPKDPRNDKEKPIQYKKGWVEFYERSSRTHR